MISPKQNKPAKFSRERCNSIQPCMSSSSSQVETNNTHENERYPHVLNSSQYQKILNLNINNAASETAVVISPPSPIPNKDILHSINNISLTKPRKVGISVEWSKTPLITSPASYAASTKRLASDIRKKQSKRHRVRLFDQQNTIHSSSTEFYENNKFIETNPTSIKRDKENDENWTLDTSCLSPEERANYYWQICYGSKNLQPQDEMKNSWSVNRKPPTKSCLSSSKLQNADCVPYSLISHEVSTIKSPPYSNNTAQFFHTPLSKDLRKERKVKFGALSAAEFHLDAPPSSALKLLDPTEALQHFSITETLEDEDESVLAETKCNSNILAEWEDDFDDYLQEDDETDDFFVISNSRRQKRRSSTIFSRSGKSLLFEEEIDKVNVEEEIEYTIEKKEPKHLQEIESGDALIHDMEDTSHQATEIHKFLEWNRSQVLEQLASIPKLLLSLPHIRYTEYYEIPLKKCIISSWKAITRRIRRAVPRSIPSEHTRNDYLKYQYGEKLLDAAHNFAFQELQVHHLRALEAVEKELVKLSSNFDKELRYLDQTMSISTYQLERLSSTQLELDILNLESEFVLLSAQLERAESNLAMEKECDEVLKYMALESMVDPFIDIQEGLVKIVWEQKESYIIRGEIHMMDTSKILLSAEWLHSCPGNSFMKLMLQDKLSKFEDATSTLDSKYYEQFATPHELLLHMSIILDRMEAIKTEIDKLDGEAKVAMNSNDQIIIIFYSREVTIYFEKGNLIPSRIDGAISDDDKIEFPNLFRKDIIPRFITN